MREIKTPGSAVLTPETPATPDSVANELDTLSLDANMPVRDTRSGGPAHYPRKEEEWDRVKDVICRLYQDEGMTLAEVQSYLIKHHNFKATYNSSIPSYLRQLTIFQN